VTSFSQPVLRTGHDESEELADAGPDAGGTRSQVEAVRALVNYVRGAAGRNAANARLLAPGTDRSAVLATVAARWAQLDPAEFPFMRQVATQLGEHDDREQFLAGIDLILAGIETIR
jgi:hypothetical protein